MLMVFISGGRVFISGGMVFISGGMVLMVFISGGDDFDGFYFREDANAMERDRPYFGESWKGPTMMRTQLSKQKQTNWSFVLAACFF